MANRGLAALADPVYAATDPQTGFPGISLWPRRARPPAARRRRLRSTPGSIAAAVVCAASLLGAGSAQAAVIKKCPSPGALRAAAGTPLTIKTNQAGMDVFCDYTHPLSATLQDSISISVEPLEESDAAFEREARAFAKALKAPFKALPGIGDEAWEYTEPRSSLDAGGLPTTTVTIVVGHREVTVISNLTAKRVLAVAKQVS